MNNPLPRIIAEIKAGFSSVEGFIAYIKARIAEPSTWAGIIGGFGGASNLHHPWDYLSAIAGSIMVLIPTKKGQAPVSIPTPPPAASDDNDDN